MNELSASILESSVLGHEQDGRIPVGQRLSSSAESHVERGDAAPPAANERTTPDSIPFVDCAEPTDDVASEATGGSAARPGWVPDDRMSTNPAYEAVDVLRSSQASFETPADSPTGRSRRNTALRLGLAGTDDFDVSTLEQHMIEKMEGTLPDDDGMRNLRQQLHEIRTLAVSTEEKARRMHDLMTEEYQLHKTQLQPESPSIGGTDSQLSDEDILPPVDPDNPFSIRLGDLEPSFSPLPGLHRQDGEDVAESMEHNQQAAPVLGCMHYKRNVKVQCFDCRRWFPCRHCHDRSRDLPFLHQLNRKKTQNMLCMLCRTPQAAAEVCANCGEYAAWYYCPKCKLWDNDSNKRIYHCDDCGICRVGEGLGKDYVHCKRCNVCISISTSASHPCLERATEGDCPLCLVRLFESQTPVVSLPCGHYMHGECYRDLMAVTYKCPVCSKSAVNMELQWRKLDDEIRAQPMPDDDEGLDGLLPVVPETDIPLESTSGESVQPQVCRPREVWIGCNDCGSRCWTAFHWLGLKCRVCDSYNTNQMAPPATRETDAERIIRQQQQHHRQHDFTGNAVLRDAGIGMDADSQRVDSAFVPSSPSASSGTDHGRGSGAHSPGRRYFVQEEEQRRPSFTAPRFPTPSLPNLRNLPNLPEMPRIPRMPNLPRPSMPAIPTLPNMPSMPSMPNLELPRFSPYEMFDAVSRSLSPMHYYLRGLDREDEIAPSGLRSANRSPTSIRSDPLAGASSLRRRVGGVDVDVDGDEEMDAWEEEDGDRSWPAGQEDADDEDDDDDIRAMEQDEEAGSSGDSDLSDLGDGDEGDDSDEMEITGHR